MDEVPNIEHITAISELMRRHARRLYDSVSEQLEEDEAAVEAINALLSRGLFEHGWDYQWSIGPEGLRLRIETDVEEFLNNLVPQSGQELAAITLVSKFVGRS